LAGGAAARHWKDFLFAANFEKKNLFAANFTFPCEKIFSCRKLHFPV